MIDTDITFPKIPYELFRSIGLGKLAFFMRSGENCLCTSFYNAFTFLTQIFASCHSGKSLFPNICGMPLLLFFWLKWAEYLAVAGLNLLAQISDRISPSGV